MNLLIISYFIFQFYLIIPGCQSQCGPWSDDAVEDCDEFEEELKQVSVKEVLKPLPKFTVSIDDYRKGPFPWTQGDASVMNIDIVDALPQVYPFDELADQCWFDVRPKNRTRFSCENPGEYWVSCSSSEILPEGWNCDNINESKAGTHRGPGIRLRGSTWPYRLRTDFPGKDREIDMQPSLDDYAYPNFGRRRRRKRQIPANFKFRSWDEIEAAMANPIESNRKIWKDQMAGQDPYTFWNTPSNFAAHTSGSTGSQPSRKYDDGIAKHMKAYKICSNCNSKDFRIWASGFAAHIINHRSKGDAVPPNPHYLYLGNLPWYKDGYMKGLTQPGTGDHGKASYYLEVGNKICKID